MVMEYFENGGQNRISFNLSGGKVLPVLLLSFDTKSISSSSCQINWKTTSEVNTEYFTIQRSEDGYSFQNLAQISAHASAVAGSTLRYSYNDYNLPSGMAYYRLEFMDKDGNHHYSNVIKRYSAAASQAIRISPQC